MGSRIIRPCGVAGLLDVREIGRPFTVEVITASVSEEFDVPRFDGEYGALFMNAAINSAPYSPSNLGTSNSSDTDAVITSTVKGLPISLTSKRPATPQGRIMRLPITNYAPRELKIG